MGATEKAKELPWHREVQGTGKTLSDITLEFVKTSHTAKEVCDKIFDEYGYDIPQRRIMERARIWGYGFGKSDAARQKRMEKINEENSDKNTTQILTDAPLPPSDQHIQDIVEEVKTMARITAYFRSIQYDRQYMVFLRVTRRLQSLLPRNEQDKLHPYISKMENT